MQVVLGFFNVFFWGGGVVLPKICILFLAIVRWGHESGLKKRRHLPVNCKISATGSIIWANESNRQELSKIEIGSYRLWLELYFRFFKNILYFYKLNWIKIKLSWKIVVAKAKYRTVWKDRCGCCLMCHHTRTSQLSM